MKPRRATKKPRASAFAPRQSQASALERVRKNRAQWGLIAVSFVLLTAAITREPKHEESISDDIDTSVVSRDEIKAGFYFQSQDIQATRDAREAAVGKVPEYYRVDADLVQQRAQELQRRLDLLRGAREGVAQAVTTALLNSTESQPADEVAARAVSAYAARLKESPEWKEMPQASAVAQWLMPDAGSLPQRQFQTVTEGRGRDARQRSITLVPEDAPPITFARADQLAATATEALEHTLKQGVRPAVTAGGGAQRIALLREDEPKSKPAAEISLGEIADTEQAADALGERLVNKVKQASPNDWAKVHEAILALAKPALGETIRDDKVYTAGAREHAKETVQPVMKEIAAGEIIQDRGKRWNPQSRMDAKTYLGLLKTEGQPFQQLLGSLASNAILVGLILACLHRTLVVYRPKPGQEVTTPLNLALLIMCVVLATGRVSSYFEPTGLILPVAAGGILCAILTNVPVAAMVSLLTATLVSAQFGYDWRLLMVSAAMSLAGVFSITKVRRRSDMAAASLKATLVGLVAAVAIVLAMDSVFSEMALRRVMLILMNGGICLLAVPGVLSPLERLFGITTDIQLLEYSDLNNEVLSRLAIEVPATYAHSLMLGQLAEAAADAIGANGLLARVCSYYHDIGKMRRPEYFIENQTGPNIHDDLSPRHSARAIASHVIQGAEMARYYHLPKPIIDGILEHHGTALIGFFYQQALKIQKHGDVREADFRYPGPKPQSPETAILMICDASESGIRSIKNPNDERVREFVDKIISQRSTDRQFDDCNLTLKQLNVIAEVVSQRILSSLHTRMVYPEPVAEAKVANVIPMPGGMET